MRSNKPRVRMQKRIGSIRRRRKGVEFLAGMWSSGSVFFLKKRNRVNPKRLQEPETQP